MESRRPAAAVFLALLPVLALPALPAGAAPAGALPGLFGSPEDRPLAIDVTVEEVPAEDVWNLVYVLPREVAGVEFVRDRNAFRAERWGVGVREGEPVWYADEGRERVCFTEPARAFSVGFRTWTDPLPKDYELNASFSEGSRLLYTGHLLVRPLATCGQAGAEPLPGRPEHRFTFRTREGRGVRVPGEAGSGELRWRPDPDQPGAADTYAYFGDLEAVESPMGEQAATVLLDPGLPAWMKREMAASLPRLVERFTDLTDTPLPFRPLLLVTWGGALIEDERSGRSFSGGTLPGLLLASAEGPGWLEESEEASREWFHRLAHETFHLWDGEIYRPDHDSEWLSEAAADHFAMDAAIAFGRVAEAEAERWLIERANDCLVRLAGRSLREAAGGSDDDAPIEVGYSCGAVALATAHGALRRAEPASDLASLFRRLFEHAAATGSYGTAPFLGGLRELRADPEAVTEIRRLILTGQSTRAEVLLQRLLAHAGVATVPVPPAEASADPGALAEVVRRAVGRCWCGTEDGPERSCDPIETGKGVTAVGGDPLRSDPAAAWERITAAARGAELQVTLDGLDTTLFCGPELFDPTWSALLAPAPAG